ncbi:hypothetical protein B0A50_03139 [Salinomyces thailandicus]|uniref:Uncharacterized protein n=1 Tax=Salinomyces thailandicus TaxID=706561 RepID=A0A4U0U6G3_9PEZI|nr:hypothetical protein B0A50_03139 [Salinomyces thailandica]
MPLLLRRRSVLDLLNSNADQEDLPRPVANSLRPETPTSPRPVSEYGLPASRLSQESRPDDMSDENDGPAPGRTKRFSMLKLRNFSESHLAARAREDAVREREDRPPVPPLPSSTVTGVSSIVRTAPTMEQGHGQQQDEDDRRVRPSLFKRSLSKPKLAEHREARHSTDHRRTERSKGAPSRWRNLQGRSSGLEDLARLSAAHTQNQDRQVAPPSYGDESQSALALPVPDPRISDSSQSSGSNASSGDHIYGQTTTTTHTVSTHTTFFRLPRRNKNRNSLFPLPVRLPPPDKQQTLGNEPETPRASVSGQSTKSLHTPGRRSPNGAALQRRHTEASPTKQRGEVPALPSPNTLLAKGALSFAEPGMGLIRNESQRSRNSTKSSPLQPPMHLGTRDRASTTSSFGRGSHDLETPPTMSGSGRNSTSTTGRSSLGGFLNLARFRQSSDPHSPRHSPGTRSKSNSFALSREALVIPEREEGDTPGKYLERLEAAVTRSMIAGILSKSADPFAQAVLRSYTRRFPFFGEPIDMSLRKFLLEAELPKETQQVDRVIQAFADRYHECNPGIFVSPDQAYVVAFSLMMLHTDAFNKNNKRKMTRQDYIKNTSGQHVADEVLGCIYDNICYTPFVHYDEEVDINGQRVMPFKPSKKSKLKGTLHETTGKKPTGPVDPYNLLVEQKLDLLRPSVKDSIAFEDPYHYRGNQQELDPYYLQHAFTHTGILQIISARSRPTAYEGQFTSNAPAPAETQAGIIDLKITKVGVLWRKAAKKKKTQRPWQEWGAILTGSQLYLFKNAHWAKGLLHQFLSQQKHGQPRTPVIFKPPLTEFKPDALIKTDNAVALVDATYNRHKHAFTFFRAGGHEEVLLADNESERNDWLALINYAAAFRAAGVRIRGMVGGNEEDLRRRDVQRLESTHSTKSVQTPSGEVTVMRGGLSPQLQRQVMAARRQIMVQKIAETEKEINEANQRLDGMLRNGRHLLVLAPIAPKTRDDVLHAAAKTDAMIKWVRRDIWRMRCHKDILALDVHQDGVSASELQALTNQQHSAPGTVKKDRPLILPRLSSKASAEPARSPPRSPISPRGSGRPKRPSTTESMDTFMGADVFHTPSESAIDENASDFWRLPPLQLDVQRDEEHRDSVSHSLLSVSSPSHGSLSHASSSSSVRQIDHVSSPKPSENASRHGLSTPTPSAENREVELLARRTMTPDTAVPLSTRGISLDGTSQSATPDSKRRGARRSLQKTLRDAHHHQSSIHRHRRNKDSESTVRSAGDADDLPEGTPGLQREKDRFILHGKQASVIQFGEDWPNERMKLRRERWRQNSSSPRSEHDVRRASQASTQASMASPSMTRELRLGAFIGEKEEAGGSSIASHEPREGGEAADVFTTSASPAQMSSTASESEGTPLFDPFQWQSGNNKRQTVIGPTPHPQRQRQLSLQKGDNGLIESDEEDFSLGPRESRRTVIASAPASKDGYGQRKSSWAGADGGFEAEGEEEEEEEENDSIISARIGDEELRRISDA